MRWSRMGRAAGVAALAVTAALLVGATPASADITVDSAVCLNGASATMTTHPTSFPTLAQIDWSAALPQPYCRQANAQVILALDVLHSTSVVSPNGTATATAPRGATALWKLRVVTSMGGKDLASVWVTLAS